METDSTRLLPVRWDQSIDPQTLFQRPEESTTICRGFQLNRKAVDITYEEAIYRLLCG